MALFSYTAIDAAGKTSHGKIEAAATVDALELLRARGLFPTGIAAENLAAPTDVTRKRFSIRRVFEQLREPPLTPLQTALLVRQLAVMIRAGLTVVQALDVVAKRGARGPTARVAAQMAAKVRAGASVSDAMEAEGLSALPLGLLKAGEASGRLAEALMQVAEFFEKSERAKHRVKMALLYPAIVLLVTGLVLVGMMVFVVPKFEAIFQDLLRGRPLPWLTEQLLSASQMVRLHVVWLAGVAALGSFGGWIFFRSNVGARFLDALKLRLPGVGDVVLKTTVARAVRTLGTLMASGVPILRALEIAQSTAGNICVAASLASARRSVEEGRAIAPVLARENVFPAMAVSLIEVGEASGELPEMLLRVAEVYEQEADEAVAAFTALIEPVMIVGLALFVGLLVVALFLPIAGIIEALV